MVQCVYVQLIDWIHENRKNDIGLLIWILFSRKLNCITCSSTEDLRPNGHELQQKIITSGEYDWTVGDAAFCQITFSFIRRVAEGPRDVGENMSRPHTAKYK